MSDLSSPEPHQVAVPPMTVMRLANLWQLQEIDSALDTRRASLEDAQARLGESDVVAAARAVVEERRAAVRSAQGTQKDLDLQAAELRGKIAPAEEKLYSGSIRNPKELRDLQEDIAQLKRQLTAIEDSDLEAIGVVEAADHELRAATAKLQAQEDAWREEQTELRDRAERMTEEVAEYERRRTDAVEGIAADLLQVYNHVRRAHQGRGVAKLDRNLCLGCRISLPVSTVNRARAGGTLVQCPNCERILYA